MNHFQKLTRKLSRELFRSIKHTRQKFINTNYSAKALFIFGSQRSGTNMLIEVLNRSNETRIYNEDNQLAFNNFRLKEISYLSRMVNKAPCTWVVFKSIMDSQHALKLLKKFPNSKAIWIYRNYQDVAESASKKWSDAQRHIIRNISERDDNWERWYTESMPKHRRELVRNCYNPEMTESSAGALKWYLRNVLFFDMSLWKYPEKILLVSYDHLVTYPKEQFDLISSFLEISIHKDFYKPVHMGSIQKRLHLPIENSVVDLCDGLMNLFIQIQPDSDRHE